MFHFYSSKGFKDEDSLLLGLSIQVILGKQRDFLLFCIIILLYSDKYGILTPLLERKLLHTRRIICWRQELLVQTVWTYCPISNKANKLVNSRQACLLRELFFSQLKTDTEWDDAQSWEQNSRGGVSTRHSLGKIERNLESYCDWPAPACSRLASVLAFSNSSSPTCPASSPHVTKPHSDTFRCSTLWLGWSLSTVRCPHSAYKVLLFFAT